MEWIKRGCVGCLVVFLVLVFVVGALVAFAWFTAGDAEPTIENREPAIPTPVAGTDASTDTPGSGSVELPPVDLGAHDLVAAGLVSITVRHGEFRILPAPPGKGLSVDATYSTATHVLSEELTTDESGAWRYDVRFEGTAGSFMTALRQLFSGVEPRITIYLPEDLSIDLEVTAAQCGGELELGGLWLRNASLDAEQGGIALEFSEPLHEPMEDLRISTRMGGFAADGLGNASPSWLEITTRMGGAGIDLRGQWARDARISISSNMGGVGVFLPDDVSVTGTPDQDRDAGPDAPVLNLELESRFGEIEIQ